MIKKIDDTKNCQEAADAIMLKALARIEKNMEKVEKAESGKELPEDRLASLSERMAKLGISAARVRASMNLAYMPWGFQPDGRVYDKDDDGAGNGVKNRLDEVL